VGIPPEVDALVLRALAKRPEERFASMAAFAEEIARIRPAIAREPGGRTTPVGRMSAGARPSGSGRPSRARMDTVGLPEEKTGEFPPTRPSNSAGITVAVLAAVVAATAAGWAWRMERQTAAAAAVVPVAAVPVAAPPVLAPVDAAPSTPVLVATVPARAPPLPAAEAVPGHAPPAPPADAPRPRPRRAAKRSDAASGDLKDPYSDDAKLKDAFP
jgi:serine/threonine-protein kinase